MTASALAVRERPILFSGEMVRAILDGRKSQTRRVVKPRPVDVDEEGPYRQHIRKAGAMAFADRVRIPCPFGQPGDRLWVRETWRCAGQHESDGFPVHYCADVQYTTDEAIHRWKPSIHMPRWASRLTLEITDIRVERVQEISEADALAEGALEATDVPYVGALTSNDARQAFSLLWDSINAARGYGWDANPYVWAISFRKVLP